jgi:TP901 family phage tail tape measure protein
MAKTGAIRAGRAYVELFADKSELVRGLKAAEYHLKDFGRNIQRLGMQMMAFASIAATPLVAGTKVFSDFEEQMAHVATMLQKPEEHMDAYRKAIRQMSVEFGESTETLAKGLYEVLAAGIPAEKALDVLAASAKAARAGMVDTAVAADAITTVLRAYSLSAERASDVSNMLFQVVSHGGISFDELAPAIGQVATNAATAGIPLEELGGALASMHRHGVKTEQAIAALNGLLTDFLNPSKEATEYARSLGFELSTATIRAEGLKGVFERISSLPPEAITTLFPNVRAIRSLLPAMKDMEGFVGDITIMTERTGATERAYRKMTATMASGFRQVKQAGLEVLRTIGEALAEPVKDALVWIKGALEGMADWISKNKELVVSFAKVVLIVFSLGSALMGIGIAAKMVGVAMGGLATLVALPAKAVLGLITVLGALGGMLFSVHGAVLAVAAALVYFSGLGGKVVDWLGQKWEELKADGEAAIQGIKDALAAGDIALAAKIFWLTLKMEWQRGVAPLKETWAVLKTDLQMGWETVVNWIAEKWLDLTYTLRRAWEAFAGWWKTAQTNLTGWIAKRMIDVQGVLDPTLNVEVAKRAIDESIGEQLAGLEREKDARKNALKEEHALSQKLLAEDYRDNLKRIDAERDATIQATEDELANTRKEWRDSIDLAKKEREAKEAAAPEAPPEFAPPKLEDLVGGIQAALGKISVVGTFTAAAAWGLGTGNTVDRIAKATEETAKNTRKLTDHAANGGLTFT